MKKTILIIFILISCTIITKAQEKGKLRTGLETGLLVPHEGGFGFSGSFELKYNIKNKINIGLRTEAIRFNKHKSYSAELLSVSATYDYYFNPKNRIFSHFCGAGLGYYFCDAVDNSTYFEEEANSKYNNPTCFVRLGTEIGKLRVSLSYNLIRKQNELNIDNKNSDYLSLSFGFYLGGGKWKTK